MALIRSKESREGFELVFMDASAQVVNFREEFSAAYEAAGTDSVRWRLERHFLAQLPKLYGRVDGILDHYNDWRLRSGR